MKNRALNRIVFGWLILLVLASLLGKVTVAAPNGGCTSAEFLKIGIGARGAGMGGAYSVISDDANAAHWNPANLVDLGGSQVALGHFAWFQDMNLEHGATAFALSDRLVLGASVVFLSYGDFDAYGIDGTVLPDDLSAYDLATGLSAGYRVNDLLSFGLTGRWVNQRLDDISASTLAFDIGTRVDFHAFSVGAVVTNLGGKLDFDGVEEELPTSARLGVAFRPIGPSLTTAVEVQKQFTGGLAVSNGAEWQYQDQYFLRAGYTYFPGDDERAFGTGFSFGAGIKFGQARLDYAFTPGDAYNSSELHRFSVVFGFGK